jgi:segregation and condensation protein A
MAHTPPWWLAPTSGRVPGRKPLQMTYEVHTRVYEGPLDLLLQLITSHQLEITELSLTDLVTEYLSYLEAIREMNLDVTSEFLMIASTLIQLKARYLLPDTRDIDLDEELALAEERDRLLSRLLACLTFKDVAAVLQHRFAGAARSLPRLVGLDQAVGGRRHPGSSGPDAGRDRGTVQRSRSALRSAN